MTPGARTRDLGMAMTWGLGSFCVSCAHLFKDFFLKSTIFKKDFFVVVRTLLFIKTLSHVVIFRLLY